jgi:hypothetical protein
MARAELEHLINCRGTSMPVDDNFR